eukprot:CAMPEP_0206168490 /NCGR_PEP_ID=MMETSP1474-20131121/32325_1 /ASSEMBLY_ACC=CAM_ASM_001110 /TAXON_ID=97495 /ORGANISM="Imantonia sp., Strain RCC918" /LENGTH=39 /DNA_ID= /DNA_START= /DNA_END= /DNA_ORIENTATION=
MGLLSCLHRAAQGARMAWRGVAWRSDGAEMVVAWCWMRR